MAGRIELPHKPDPAFRIVGEMQIAKLHLELDDVLVVRTDRHVTMEMADRIRHHLLTILPEGARVLIVNPDIELSVLTRSEIDARLV